jgi:hypothetical protein
MAQQPHSSELRKQQIQNFCIELTEEKDAQFEKVYQQLNEQFINEIIDFETERQKNKHNAQSQKFLLIGETELIPNVNLPRQKVSTANVK